MRKLSLSLKKGTTTIFFNPPLKFGNFTRLKVNKVNILWTIYNVGTEDKILIDSTEHTVPHGYYTFDDLKDFLEGKNCVVTLEKSGQCTITPPSSKTLNLKKVGKLLGFNENDTLDAKKLSPYLVNVHGGLKTISIYNNKINTFNNFDMGKKSEKLCQVLMPTISVYGYTSAHSLETEVFLENGECRSMDFIVLDDSFITDKDSYLIQLDCLIEEIFFFVFPRNTKKYRKIRK